MAHAVLLSSLVAMWLAAAADSAPVPTPALMPDDPLLPDGYRLAAYLDCGAPEGPASEDGPRFALVSGEDYGFPGYTGAAATAAFAAERVVFEIHGLDPDAEYVLGFTWWDADDSGRIQSVQFAADSAPGWSTVLPPSRPAAIRADKSTWARALLPLAPPYDRAASLRVAFVNESGPNAVVSELWLLERVETAPRRRVLIVTGDDYGGHDWRATAPALAEVLREDPRLEVSITECPGVYGSPLLDHYDATVLHFKDYAERLPLDPSCREGLRRHVAAGKGLVLTHFACGAFQEWDEFVEVAGRVWNPQLRGHDPHGTFTVRMTDTRHPVTRSMTDFDVTDELYTCLDGDAPIRVLSEATSVVDQRVYPMAFIVEGTGGRVFHSVLGHDTAAYRAPGVRALYRRAAAWAAGLEPDLP